jgi:hypothetical protein
MDVTAAGMIVKAQIDSVAHDYRYELLDSNLDEYTDGGADLVVVPSTAANWSVSVTNGVATLSMVNDILFPQSTQDRTSGGVGAVGGVEVSWYDSDSSAWRLLGTIALDQDVDVAVNERFRFNQQNATIKVDVSPTTGPESPQGLIHLIGQELPPRPPQYGFDTMFFFARDSSGNVDTSSSVSVPLNGTTPHLEYSRGATQLTLNGDILFEDLGISDIRDVQVEMKKDTNNRRVLGVGNLGSDAASGVSGNDYKVTSLTLSL